MLHVQIAPIAGTVGVVLGHLDAAPVPIARGQKSASAETLANGWAVEQVRLERVKSEAMMR